VRLARALIVMLSANTMMAGLQIEIICRGMDYKFARFGVVISGVQFITAEYYKRYASPRAPLTHPADAMQIKLFAAVPRAKMVFAPSSLMGVSASFWKGRWPVESKIPPPRASRAEASASGRARIAIVCFRGHQYFPVSGGELRGSSRTWRPPGEGRGRGDAREQVLRLDRLLLLIAHREVPADGNFKGKYDGSRPTSVHRG
jgi:hypothetical protein